MTNSVLSVQGIHAQTRTQQTTPPPKNQQATIQTATRQDKVTIGQQAQQALANNTKPAASGDVEHDGYNY